jgi:hypothetical protein
MKIRRVGAQLFLADRRKERRTDRHDEANSRFRNLGQRLKTYLAQEGEENNRVTEVCERSIRIKGSQVWENRKDGFRSENVYRLSYDVSCFVS